MKQLYALIVALVVTVAGAQTVQTTPNLITSGTNHTWTGVQTGAIPSNYMPGGPTPKYDPATNTFQFSYSQATVAQTIAINNALSGSGVQVNGYNYSYEARNMNGDDRQGSVDTFTVATKMTSNTGSTLLSSSQTHNTKFDWSTFSGVKTATAPYGLSNLGSLQFSVTGMDSGYWGGYFGPQIRNVNMSLNYTVDPCVTNPAYSTTCANYNTVSSSNNLVPNPTGYAVWNNNIDQSYAINQALGQAGANVMIHGFQWGYQANANGPYCAFSILICLDNRTPSVTTNVSITDNNGASIYSVNRTYTNSHNTTDYRYVFPSSRNLLTLGNFNFTATANDDAYIGSMWSKALYTPDPCTVNPLSSSSCPGFQQAYHNQQCSINPLYASDCVGYTQAFLTQQCNASQLYSPSCPGYVQAYHDQQCSINPLYASDCSGYAQAYHDQQCNISALYATDCSGYQQAYHDQQCSLNSLFATDCSGYAAAYHNQQCSLSPLYMSDCAGYQLAYLTQQCNSNPLYSNQCTGYAAAYKSQQCTLNQLYATDCPGYQQAYFNQQCQANGLYDRTCPNYGAAYAVKYVTATPTTASVSTTSSVAISTESTATVTSNPAAVAISDPVVSAAVATPSTTSATSPTSVTSVISAPSAATSPAAIAATTPVPAPAPSAETKQEAKKTETAVAKAAAKGGAAAAAKDAAAAAANATSMEAQVATQGLVVGLMGYVPGFTAYQNAIVPDALAAQVARQYMQPNVDNRNAQRRLSGASDAKWQEMVDSQYKIGN